MMDSDKFIDAVDRFHGQWLKLDKLAITPKGTDAEWPATRAAAIEEALRFTRAQVQQAEGLGAYFYSAAPYTFVDPILAAVYGLPAPDPAGDGFAQAPLDPQQRAGLLTQVAFLALHAKAETTSPVHRGIFVRKNVLCGILFPPPPEVDTSIEDPPPTVTMREQLEEHRRNPSCRACHELTDPIGFTFEHYDAVGRYRTIEAGRPVDASGYIAGSKTSDGQFNDAIGLSMHLSQSDEVAACLAKKWFAFTFGRPPTDAETCALDAAVSPQTDVRSLLLDFIQSDAFRKIRN